MFALYNIATVLAVRYVKHCLLFAEIPFGIIRKKDIKFFGDTFLSRKVSKIEATSALIASVATIIEV